MGLFEEEMEMTYGRKRHYYFASMFPHGQTKLYNYWKLPLFPVLFSYDEEDDLEHIEVKKRSTPFPVPHARILRGPAWPVSLEPDYQNENIRYMKSLVREARKRVQQYTQRLLEWKHQAKLDRPTRPSCAHSYVKVMQLLARGDPMKMVRGIPVLVKCHACHEEYVDVISQDFFKDMIAGKRIGMEDFKGYIRREE